MTMNIIDAACAVQRAYQDVSGDPYERQAVALLPSRLRHALYGLDRAVRDTLRLPVHAPWIPDMGVMTVTAVRYGLTYQQRNAVILRAVGATYEQIAAALRIATNTARRHVEHAYRQLDVHDGVQALRVLHGYPARDGGG